MGRIGQPIELTKEQHVQLITMSRSHKLENRYVIRANIILYSAQGKTYDEIVNLTGELAKLLLSGEIGLERKGLQG